MIPEAWENETTLSLYFILGGCPQNWYIFGEYIYYVSSDLVDHDTAVAECEQLGAKLATIHSTEEQRFIESNLFLWLKYQYFVCRTMKEIKF